MPQNDNCKMRITDIEIEIAHAVAKIVKELIYPHPDLS